MPKITADTKLYQLCLRYVKQTEVATQYFCPFCNVGYFDDEVRPCDCEYCKGKAKNAAALTAALDGLLIDVFEELHIATKAEDKAGIVAAQSRIAVVMRALPEGQWLEEFRDKLAKLQSKND